MQNEHIRNEVLEAVKGRFNTGEAFKIKHRFKNNGDICTPEHKTPAMIVTRQRNGWIFFCHRCHASGKIYDNNISPKETKNRLDGLKVKGNKECNKVHLPSDYKVIPPKAVSEGIPSSAYVWLWKYGITYADCVLHGIGWSPKYNRIIIPLYEEKELVGFIGREVKYKTKEEREKAGVPKWITVSKKGERRYFTAAGTKSGVVICEDAISAIKINRATEYTAISLLNSDISKDMVKRLRNFKNVYVWLDGDMLAKSVKSVDKLRQFGHVAKMIHTEKDPKEYSCSEIENKLTEYNNG